MTGQVITGWNIGAPEDWAPLPLQSAADSPEAQALIHDAAELLADEGAARERLERFLLTAQPGLVEDHLILLGVWVPDREAGIPQAVMKAELLTGGDIDTFERTVLTSDPPEGVERVNLETVRVDVAAGPAVIVDHQGAVDGTIEQYLQFCVFPPGTTDAISLAFSTTALHLVEDFAAATRVIAETLEVRLGDPSEAIS